MGEPLYIHYSGGSSLSDDIAVWLETNNYTANMGSKNALDIKKFLPVRLKLNVEKMFDVYKVNVKETE